MFVLEGLCSLRLETLHFVDGRGGALHADGAGDISMKDVSFTSCEADYGGALDVDASGNLYMENAIFTNCKALVRCPSPLHLPSLSTHLSSRPLQLYLHPSLAQKRVRTEGTGRPALLALSHPPPRCSTAALCPCGIAATSR